MKFLDFKNDERAALPERGWAPGGYICLCMGCGERYSGEKRSYLCASCAYDGTPSEKAVRFTRELLRQFWSSGQCGLEGENIWHLAKKHGVIVSVPGGYNPEVHGECDYDAEPGDEWYMTIKGIADDPHP